MKKSITVLSLLILSSTTFASFQTPNESQGCYTSGKQLQDGKGGFSISSGVGSSGSEEIQVAPLNSDVFNQLQIAVNTDGKKLCLFGSYVNGNLLIYKATLGTW